MHSPRPRRSALYMPASNARAIAKARTLPCDVVIFDLEDAVAPSRKAQARAALVEALQEGGFGERELIVRVNGLATEWGNADCAALTSLRLDAVLVPKIDDGEAVNSYRQRLGDLPIWAMVETARALLRLESVASAKGLAALVVGTNDIAKELGSRPGRERIPLHGFLATIVAAGRAHGLSILDGVYNMIDDKEGFVTECQQGVAFGFDGKTLIHPSQIEGCNAAFSPVAEEVAWARKVENAYAKPDAADKGAIQVDGQMVERLHLEQAKRILALVERLGCSVD